MTELLDRTTTYQCSSEREIDQYLSRSNRLLAVGELAAGVAHNFGNVLMSVSVTLELLQMKLASNPALDSDLLGVIDGAQEQVRRGSNIIHRLLALAKGVPSIITDTNVSEIIENALTLCATHPMSKKIDLAKEVPDGLPIIKTDAGQLEEILLNLLLNALQSSESGTVTVGARLCDAVAGFIEIYVSDQGCGIPREELGRIFDPFFSKRHDGVLGTGLGLSCSLVQVNRMGGTMEVDSQLGVGSTFIIKLPVSVDTVSAKEGDGRYGELQGCYCR